MNSFRTDVHRGDLFWVDWSPGRGSEQSGVRPALIVQANEGNTNPRYNNTIVAAVTTHGRATIPTLVEITPMPENGLTATSYVKCEQLVTIAKERLQNPIGTLSDGEMARVDLALRRALGLS